MGRGWLASSKLFQTSMISCSQLFISEIVHVDSGRTHTLFEVLEG